MFKVRFAKPKRKPKVLRTPVRPLKPGETGVWAPGGDPGPGAGIASVVAYLDETLPARDPQHSLDPGTGDDDGW